MADDRCTTGLLSLNLCGTNTDGTEVEFAKGMQEFKDISTPLSSEPSVYPTINPVSRFSLGTVSVSTVKDREAADKDWRGCVLEVDPSAEPWAPGSQLGTMMKQEGDDASHWVDLLD
ncbi:unnamed protein product [Boreogadus saida]